MWDKGRPTEEIFSDLYATKPVLRGIAALHPNLHHTQYLDDIKDTLYISHSFYPLHYNYRTSSTLPRFHPRRNSCTRGISSGYLSRHGHHHYSTCISRLSSMTRCPDMSHRSAPHNLSPYMRYREASRSIGLLLGCSMSQPIRQ